MTVQELVRLLATYPSDVRVVVNGYEDGYDDLSPKQLSVVKISLNTGKRNWEGMHGEAEGIFAKVSSGTEVEDALVLRRVSN